MTQNIYDDDGFFEGYGRLERSVQGLEGAAEWPALQALLPPMHGLAVLDLGCGYGWFCRWAREQGARRVLGLDVSEKMLARAEASTNDGAIVYRREDLERVELPEASFDLVYSSLALHYLVRLDRLIGQVRRALVPGGRFVVSVEHPIFTAGERPDWIDGGGRQKVWPVAGYLDEGPRVTDWLAPGVVKQHRTIGTYLDLLLGAGLSLTRLVEWGPSRAQIDDRTGLALDHQRPAFLLIAARG